MPISRQLEHLRTPYDPALWAALSAIPGAVFEEGTPLATPAAGTQRMWFVTSTIIEGSVWSDTNSKVTIHDRPMLLSHDGTVMGFRNRILYQTGEGTYHGEIHWTFEDTPTVGTYDLHFSSATAFTMDRSVAHEGGATGVFQDEARRSPKPGKDGMTIADPLAGLPGKTRAGAAGGSFL